MDNLNSVGVISPIRKEFSDAGGPSMASSLSKQGMNMFPGTAIILTPFKERDGSYRTGLDPEAFYIKAMEKPFPEEAEAEKKRVTAYRDRVAGMTGLELGSRSDYYTKMFDTNMYGTPNVAVHLKLFDQKNTFNLRDVQAALTYYWARVHPDIAPSYNTWKENKPSARCPYPSQCKFFVEEFEVENALTYNQKTAINKAIASLENMNDVRQKKIAVLLGLPVGFSSTKEVVYNELDNFIKATTSVGTTNNVDKFNQVVQLQDAVFETKFLVKEAISTGVYRVAKFGKIFNGQIELANSEEDVVNYLLDPKNQEELLNLKEQVRQKRTVENFT